MLLQSVTAQVSLHGQKQPRLRLLHPHGVGIRVQQHTERLIEGGFRARMLQHVCEQRRRVGSTGKPITGKCIAQMKEVLPRTAPRGHRLPACRTAHLAMAQRPKGRVGNLHIQQQSRLGLGASTRTRLPPRGSVAWFGSRVVV